MGKGIPFEERAHLRKAIQASFDQISSQDGQSPGPLLGTELNSNEPHYRSEQVNKMNAKSRTEASKSDTIGQCIDDRIRSMQNRIIGRMPVIDEVDGDTLIFIDPAPQQPEQTDIEYREYCVRSQQPIIVRSEKLKTASKVFRARLENPSFQHRLLRRRGLVNKLSLSQRYVLDLTPPTEGDDAVYLTATLSCSNGIRLWHQAELIWHVPETLVGGHDEYIPWTLETRLARQSESADYSPMRHRCAIERALAAIQERDIDLDSAVKVWNLFAVAQHFEIKSNYLEDCIVTWLRAEPNNVFFEVNPETATLFATGFENCDVARDAFAILVGEAALDNDVAIRSPEMVSKICSVFGRQRPELPEILQERVEYASRTFAKRIHKIFDDLFDVSMLWIDDLESIKALRNNTDTEARRIAEQLVDALKKFTRDNICETISSEHDSLPELRIRQLAGQELVHRHEVVFVWATLDIHSRALTRNFWLGLQARNIRPSMRKWLSGKEAPGHGTRSCLCDNHQNIGASYLSSLIQEGRRVVNGPVTMSDSLKSQIWTAWDDYPDQEAWTLSDMAGLSLHQQENRSLEKSNKPQFPHTNHAEELAVKTKVEADESTEGPSAGIGPSPIATLSPEYENFFDQEAYYTQVMDYFRTIAERVLAPSDSLTRQYPYIPQMTNTLTCLSDEEWKYLPLWAGGLDDGTRSIYTEDIMDADADAGFAGGHGIHSVASACSSDISGSDDDYISVDSMGTTFNTSTAVDDGHSDALHRHRTYAASSISGMDEDQPLSPHANSINSSEGEEARARRLLDSFEQEQAVADRADAEQKQKRSALDMDYPEMFTQDDEEMLDFESDSDMTEVGRGDIEHIDATH